MEVTRPRVGLSLASATADGHDDKARVGVAWPGRGLQRDAFVTGRQRVPYVGRSDAGMDLGHDVDPDLARPRGDLDHVAEPRVPQREEHAGARVRVDVRIPPGARRGAG